jgi:fido (protein-threonine AMPylation protein)
VRLKNDNLGDSDWERIRNLGLHPEIRTEEQYLAKVDEGINRAKELLRGESQPVLNPQTIRDLHREVFCELYPPEAHVAGEYTQNQLKITGPGDEFFAGAPPHKIEPSLRELQKVFTQRFAEAQTDEQKILTCIDYHVQFKAIQAFPDGNGRTASLLLEHQLSLSLNRNITLNLDAKEYRHNMWLALQEGTLGPAIEQIKGEVQKQLKESPTQTREMGNTRTSAQQPNQDSAFDRTQTQERVSAQEPGAESGLPRVRVQSHELAKTVETDPVKQKAVVDRVFLDTVVLGGAGEALTQTYQVTIPQSVAHAISSQNAPNEVREWLTQSLQKPATDVTIDVPKNTVPDNDRLLRGSRDAMQLTRENPGSVLLSGARWGMWEAAKENLPVQDPAGFIEQADRSGILNAETVAEKLAARQEYRLVGPAAEIQAVAEQIQDERNIDVAKELEALRDEVEEQQTLSDFENALKQAPENIHGLDRTRPRRCVRPKQNCVSRKGWNEGQKPLSRCWSSSKKTKPNRKRWKDRAKTSKRIVEPLGR